MILDHSVPQMTTLVLHFQTNLCHCAVCNVFVQCAVCNVLILYFVSHLHSSGDFHFVSHLTFINFSTHSFFSSSLCSFLTSSICSSLCSSLSSSLSSSLLPSIYLSVFFFFSLSSVLVCLSALSSSLFSLSSFFFCPLPFSFLSYPRPTSLSSSLCISLFLFLS